MAKNKKGEPQSVFIDPAVQAIMGDRQQREALRQLTPAQRKERRRQAARVRVVYDVPEWLKAALEAEAEAEECSASSLGAFLLAVGYRLLKAGQVRLAKVNSDGPRFRYLVEVSEDDAGL